MSMATLPCLPAELLQHILGLVHPLDLASVAQTCHRLHSASCDDRLWLAHINENLTVPISSPHPAKSFRHLYTAHFPHWFLTRNPIWFGDAEPNGKLLLARFNPQTAAIQAYTLVAVRGPTTVEPWAKDPQVVLHHFNPKVSLDRHQPVVKLDLERPPPSKDLGNSSSDDDSSPLPSSALAHETLMETFDEPGLCSSFMLCRSLPPSAIFESSRVWPPLLFPALARTRNTSSDRYVSAGHRPTHHADVSPGNFRVRKWLEFTGRSTHPAFLSLNYNGIPAALGLRSSSSSSSSSTSSTSTSPNTSRLADAMRIRVPEDLTTYAALPSTCYTPSPLKPWQGIWCGDYSAHGCEFLVIHQPDAADARPLPSGLDWLLPWLYPSHRDRSAAISAASAVVEDTIRAILDAVENDDENLMIQPDEALPPMPHTLASIAANRLPPVPPPSTPSPSSSDPSRPPQPSGRLEAIKLTGDPNIPRGEYTFIAPDISDEGLLRIADEHPFRGARIVRSAGHIAARGFRRDQYTPSQLIFIDSDTLAQYWEGFGHISYYRRVDIGALLADQGVKADGREGG